jgi:hypothetical protein
MKQCPQCKNHYTDDNLYCLNDGTPLSDFMDQTNSATIAFMPNDTPTQVLPYVRVQTQTQPSAVSKWLYLLIGAMAVMIIALGYAFYFSRPAGEVQRPAAITPNANSPNSAANVNAIKPSNSNPTPSVAPVVQMSPGGIWNGDWNSMGKTATNFSAVMDITDDGNGKINGKIIWILRATNNPKKIGKTGLSATEYVQGTFDQTTHLLSLKGYRKDDPYDLVILDKYQLSLAADNSTMNGKSIGGRFILKR